MEVRLFRLSSELACLLARIKGHGRGLGRLLEPGRRRTVLLGLASHRFAVAGEGNRYDLLCRTCARSALADFSLPSLFWEQLRSGADYVQQSGWAFGRCCLCRLHV